MIKEVPKCNSFAVRQIDPLLEWPQPNSNNWRRLIKIFGIIVYTCQIFVLKLSVRWHWLGVYVSPCSLALVSRTMFYNSTVRFWLIISNYWYLKVKFLVPENLLWDISSFMYIAFLECAWWQSCYWKVIWLIYNRSWIEKKKKRNKSKVYSLM